jgi:hypothetical protein
MRKKLFLVKYEVIATTMEHAIKTARKGSIYEISLADEKSWPVEKKELGFKDKNKKKLSTL